MLTPVVNAWLQFALCAVLIMYAGSKLARYGNVIADKTGLGGTWIGLTLLGAIVLTFGLQLATIYLPWLNPIFKTEPLTAAELGFCLAAASLVFVAVEVEKWLVRRGLLYRRA